MSEERVLGCLEPKEVFNHFEALTRIPRGSGNEKEVSDYIAELARQAGYPVKQDKAWNVAIDIPASPGYENRKKTIIQSHIDMVCEKTAESSHDFEKDPLEIYIEDGYVRAKDTTLGADDGSGAAMMLAIMDKAKDWNHPALQLLFTTGEEIMFVGASAMDPSFIDGDQLIGLDCSSSDILMVSCAGLSISEVSIPVVREPLADGSEKTVFTVNISNLTSGHSGNMIHLGRVNGIKLMGEILAAMKEAFDFSLLEAHSEGLVNVINQAADFRFCVDNQKADEAEAFTRQLFSEIQNAYRRTEPNMWLELGRQSGAAEDKLSDSVRDRLIAILEFLPFGANTIIDDAFTLAESSSNIGNLLEKDGKIVITMSIRSNSEYQHSCLLRKIRTIAEKEDAAFTLLSKSLPWEYNPDSALLKKGQEIFRRINQKDPVIKMIHASVEATVFIEKMKAKGKSIDVLNIGCDQFDVHTVNERLKIDSVGKAYKLLTALIEEV